MKALLVSIALVAPVAAMANQELAQKKNCMACHAIDKKLAEKIQKGGSGVWGPVPMPPNTQVSPAEAETLAKWVLSLK